MPCCPLAILCYEPVAKFCAIGNISFVASSMRLQMISICRQNRQKLSAKESIRYPSLAFTPKWDSSWCSWSSVMVLTSGRWAIFM